MPMLDREQNPEGSRRASNAVWIIGLIIIALLIWALVAAIAR
jgi:hypothetical protein